MLTSNSFYPRITVPTRLTNTRGTLIDNFLCKLTDNTINTTSGVLIKRFSDYQLYFIKLVGMCSFLHPGLHCAKYYMCYLDLLSSHFLN